MRKIIFIIFHLVAISWASTALASQPEYAIIIDAGSTGSRLHLFKYEQTDKLPLIEDILSEKITPGLSSFKDQPEKAGSSLKTLLDKAGAQLAVRHINPHTVSISILATAGMRLLPTDKAQAILEAVRVYLQQHYDFPITEVAVIPEKMEGVYGWLDVNYLLHNFDNTAKGTVGILDMGGASTEIAFARDGYQTYKSNNDMALKINGRIYHVFSANFLGLGQDQARNAIKYFSSGSACYPSDYPVDDNTIGNFNLFDCQFLYGQVLYNYKVSDKIPPLPHIPFVAFSAYYYAGHFFAIENATNQTAITQRIKEVCLHSWETLQKTYPDVPKKYLANYCSNGAYILELLFNSYQLKDGQLNIKNKIDGKEIDWPMGALLFKLI